jgi:putative transposase
MLSNFPKVVKQFLKKLPQDDYPKLSTFAFVSCWLSYVLDQSQTSMTSLFQRLNMRGIDIDKSTFSKASKKRNSDIFCNLFEELRKELKKEKEVSRENLVLFPLDSTIVTLTSKLMWSQGYGQVKLFSGINNCTNEPDGILIHFGNGHDSKYGETTIEAIPKESVGIMDRGFAKLNRIKNLMQLQKRYFVIRVKNNMNLELLENGKAILGTGKDKVEVRVVSFSDLETRSEFRLATNLSEAADQEVSNDEVAEIYKKRWQIELFWKFLKMHLKLDRLITKNVNGITIQIYTCLIAYILLELVEIPKEFGCKMLDKLRYLQAFMCENISYLHWFRKTVILS